MRALAILLVLIAAALPVQAGTVVVIGDSIAVGIGEQLAHRLPGTDVEIRAAVGATVRHVVVQATRAAGERPAAVVIEVGTNDAVGGAPMPIARAMSLALAPLTAARIPIVCVETLPGVRPDLAEGVPSVARAVQASCRDAGASWVQIGPAALSKRAADQVHLSAAGYGLIADDVARVVRPLIAPSLPPSARKYASALATEIEGRWPTAPLWSALAAQVEQETCISLKSKGCWNPRTELKTDREYGFGLGQLTVTSRFNAWDEVRGMDAGLRAWKWDDRYDPVMQLRALVVKDRFNFDRFPLADTPEDRLAFSLAAYNGGVGGTLSDIKLCRATAGCDPGQWFGNVERTSLKARTKVKGYGQDFFSINRGYVRNVLIVRRPKYVEAMGHI